MGRTARESQGRPRRWHEIIARPRAEGLPFARFFEEAIGERVPGRAQVDGLPDFSGLWGEDSELIEDWFAEGELLHEQEWDVFNDFERAEVARRSR